MHSLTICFPCQILLGWSTKTDDTGGACGTYQGEQKSEQDSGYKTWKRMFWKPRLMGG